ncbi:MULTISPECIES: aminoglycoside N(3)-acetyltransferase [Streptomyces]|uniref:aminoglycoside N(3)-acetyltransferase n=1 Tax=Streptomyces TaxID=1883 RepID=UPI0006F5C7D1|nr:MULTISPECIES: AAC(3) family N-acetyltransferase [Streptomyces]KQX94475.1 aminoglycoside phosphotransferase [Streptomyces sp. Root1319]KQZ05562.1 aminoglycoside phosphotransferase [Streptomyces sp. Root55]MDX2742698.1 AAC(3) family N-acetyltransferase [Streptomyces sp. NRRL_B-2557]WRY80825.1 AAC(3) family N-acetyltransferase [Streptomyces clavifer]WUC26586.1 AAC(3) family N-acetyltransferase [Streptomyces clavifer]
MPVVTQHLVNGERAAAAQLAGLGVERGGVLLVHASMRSVGGDAGAMADALRTVLGPEGTLVVPSFTPENSDTSRSYLERVRGLSDEARAALRAAMPPFDREVSPAPAMGRLAETVRLTPGAERSAHPQTSFTAIGPAARKLLAEHRQDCHLGEDSPLARLYEADAQILLLGTGFDTCTAFHLAEYRLPAPPRRLYRCVVAPQGERGWWEYEDVALDDGDFAALGRAFECADTTGAVRTGPVGSAGSRLVRLRAAVDFAVDWLGAHRSGGA